MGWAERANPTPRKTRLDKIDDAVNLIPARLIGGGRRMRLRLWAYERFGKRHA